MKTLKNNHHHKQLQELVCRLRRLDHKINHPLTEAIDPEEEELKLLHFLKYLDECMRLLAEIINEKRMQKSEKKSG